MVGKKGTVIREITENEESGWTKNSRMVMDGKVKHRILHQRINRRAFHFLGTSFKGGILDLTGRLQMKPFVAGKLVGPIVFFVLTQARHTSEAWRHRHHGALWLGRAAGDDGGAAGGPDSVYLTTRAQGGASTP